MEGGKIFGNSTTTATAISTATSLSYGGGVYMRSGASFAKTSGTIYGYAVNDPGNSNVVKAKDVIQNDNGHAVWAYSGSNPYHKETTVGPAVKLYYNDLVNGTGGW
jgi:hypothetical protein